MRSNVIKNTLEFFHFGFLKEGFNDMLILLGSKVNSPDKVTQFRLIGLVLPIKK